jgi:hypothetical protein
MPQGRFVRNLDIARSGGVVTDRIYLGQERPRYEPNRLENLTRALGQLNSVAGDIFRQRAAGQRALEDAQLRQLAALKAHDPAAFQKGLDEGRWTESNSPFFNIYYNDALGRVAGNKFEADAEQFLAKNPTPDDKTLQDFLGHSHDQYTKDQTDSIYLGEFSNHYDRVRLALESKMLANRTTAAEEHAYGLVSQEFGEAVRDYYRADGASLMDLGNTIVAVADRAAHGGLNKRKIAGVLAQEIVAGMEKSGDTDLAQLGDIKLDGIRLRDYFPGKIENAESATEGHNIALANAKRVASDRSRRRAGEEGLVELSRFLEQNHGKPITSADIPEALKQKIELGVDPDFRVSALPKMLTGGDEAMPDSEYGRRLAEAYQGNADPQELLAYINAGNPINRSQLNKLFSVMNKGSESAKSLETDPIYRGSRSQIKGLGKLITTSMLDFDKTAPIQSELMVQNLTEEYNQRISEYLAENPDAKPEERRAASKEIVDEMRRRVDTAAKQQGLLPAQQRTAVEPSRVQEVVRKNAPEVRDTASAIPLDQDPTEAKQVVVEFKHNEGVPGPRGIASYNQFIAAHPEYKDISAIQYIYALRLWLDTVSSSAAPGGPGPAAKE